MKEKLGIGSDFALSRALGMAQPVISKLRNGRLAIDRDMLLCIHEATGIGMADLEFMLAPTGSSHA